MCFGLARTSLDSKCQDICVKCLIFLWFSVVTLEKQRQSRKSKDTMHCVKRDTSNNATENWSAISRIVKKSAEWDEDDLWRKSIWDNIERYIV